MVTRSKEVWEVGTARWPCHPFMSQHWGSCDQDPRLWKKPSAASCLASKGWIFCKQRLFPSGAALDLALSCWSCGSIQCCSVPLPSSLVVTWKVAAPTQQVASKAESPPWERCPGEASWGELGNSPPRHSEREGKRDSCMHVECHWAVKEVE